MRRDTVRAAILRNQRDAAEAPQPLPQIEPGERLLLGPAADAAAHIATPDGDIDRRARHERRKRRPPPAEPQRHQRRRHHAIGNDVAVGLDRDGAVHVVEPLVIETQRDPPLGLEALKRAEKFNGGVFGRRCGVAFVAHAAFLAENARGDQV